MWNMRFPGYIQNRYSEYWKHFENLFRRFDHRQPRYVCWFYSSFWKWNSFKHSRVVARRSHGHCHHDDSSYIYIYYQGRQANWLERYTHRENIKIRDLLDVKQQKPAGTLKTDNYSTLTQTKMFINVTDKRVRSKRFRVFSRNVFVQMRDTANRYDAIEDAILLVKKINKLSRSFLYQGGANEKYYRQIPKRVFREVQSRKKIRKAELLCRKLSLGKRVSIFLFCKIFASSFYKLKIFFIPLYIKLYTYK